MFFSRNGFFKQSIDILAARRKEVEILLRMKGIDSTDYLIAYDFFCANTQEFDG
jgi:uncharacterized protein YebE (UPF0316 family)